MTGIDKKPLLRLAAAFLFCGAAHVLLYRVPMTISFAPLFCSVVCLIWAFSVRNRVTDRRLRHGLMTVAGVLLLYLVLQITRYELFLKEFTLQRYLWYAFYLPLLAMPVLCLWIAALIHRPQDKPLPAAAWIPAGVALLLLAGVMTNDLHFWFKSFPDGVLMDTGRERSGWLYYAISAFIYGGCITAFLILLKKSRSFGGQRFRWLPLIPLCCGVIYFLLYPLQLDIALFRCRVWNMGEMLTLCMITALEACIQTGLIPANTNYERLFARAKLPAAILDAEDRLRYVTTGTAYPFPASEHLQIRRHPIRGGRIEWAVDVEPLTRLNRELADAAQGIESRNACLVEETKLLAQKAEVETRNRIYDGIVRAVQPQIRQINALLEAEDPPFEQRLRKIAVLDAYIKRRSNMELLAESGRLPSKELLLAVSESLTYLRLQGVYTVVTAEGAADYPAPLVICAYEQTERVIEDCLDTLAELMVYLEAAEGCLRVRMMLRSDALTVRTDSDDTDCAWGEQTVSVAKDGQDMRLVFTFTEGGGAP